MVVDCQGPGMANPEGGCAWHCLFSGCCCIQRPGTVDSCASTSYVDACVSIARPARRHVCPAIGLLHDANKF